MKPDDLLNSLKSLLSVLVAVSRPIEIRNRAMMILVCRYGLSSSDISELQVSDVNPSGLSLSVDRNGKRRDILLSGQNFSYLDDWLKVRYLWANEESSDLFIALGNRETGGKLNPRSIRYVITSFIESANFNTTGASYEWYYWREIRREAA